MSDMNHYLYIEPYSFLFKKGEKAGLYNTIDGVMTKIIIPKEIDTIVSELADKKVVKLPFESLEDMDLKNFLTCLKQSFNGDVIACEQDVKPAIFSPIINNQRAFERIKTVEWEHINSYVLEYLDEIFLYINGLDEDIDLPKNAYMQTPSYLYSKDILSLHLFRHFLRQIPDKHIDRFNILGGNILDYEELPELLNLIRTKCTIINMFILYTSYNEQKVETCLSYLSSISLVIPLVDFNESTFGQVYESIIRLDIRFKTVFLVTSDYECQVVDDIVYKYELVDYLVVPLFVKDNFDFFKRQVFIDEDDLLSCKLSKRNIYANQSINTNYFGRLTIFPDSSICVSANGPVVGNLNDADLSSIIYKELSERNKWLKIRDGIPCNNCIYQWICPPLSDYEQILNRSTLCNLSNE